MEKNLIIIVGYAGSGKSHLSNKFKTKNYFIVQTDEVIRKMQKIIDKKYTNINLFNIYNEEKYIEILNYYNSFIKKLIKYVRQNNNIVIEGQLHTDTIKQILAIKTKNKINYKIIVVKPKNKNIWKKHLIERFEESPEKYGRIGYLKISDEANNSRALNYYIKNGKIGKPVLELINKMVIEKYHKHRLVLEYYKNNFDNVVVFNSE